MKILSSRDVQKNFGSVADLVGSGESVRVTKYGRPAFLMIPETSDSDEILRRVAGRRLTNMMAAAEPSSAATALSQEEVNRLIRDCFA